MSSADQTAAVEKIDQQGLVPGSDRDMFTMVSNAALPVAVVVLGIFFWQLGSGFMSLNNLIAISVQSAALMTISIPFAVLLIQGHVDLSVGSNLALSGVIAGVCFTQTNMSVSLVILITLTVGTLVGLFNGALVAVAGMSPIVVTLGTLTVVRGLARQIAPTPVFGFPENFQKLGRDSAFGLPYLTWIAIFVLIIGAAAMILLPLGRQVVAIGVNSRAAYLVGVRVKLIGLLTFAAVGLASAAAALMTVSRFNSAPSGTLGVGFELQVLTAVLLGGVPFDGGKGSVLRVALGVWLLGMLRNGLILMNVPTPVSLIVTGTVLILAAALELARVRRAA